MCSSRPFKCNLKTPKNDDYAGIYYILRIFYFLINKVICGKATSSRDKSLLQILQINWVWAAVFESQHCKKQLVYHTTATRDSFLSFRCFQLDSLCHITINNNLLLINYIRAFIRKIIP